MHLELVLRVLMVTGIRNKINEKIIKCVEDLCKCTGILCMQMCEGFHINVLGFILKVLEFYVYVNVLGSIVNLSKVYRNVPGFDENLRENLCKCDGG